ncbi:MAG: hypothetical protein JWN17_2971 [Frankiales bacterium]|nr:hypothetical protein [Frankiales bacterium]
MHHATHAERLRRAALHAYAVLDREPVPELDGLVELASRLTGLPVASVNLLDDVQQWQAAGHGGALPQVPVAEALCSVVVDEGRTVVVDDVSVDARWRDNPFVDGRHARVRAYAAAPLVAPDGVAFGTLCVVDEQPRTLDEAAVRGLELLAEQVVRLFEGRRRARQLVEAVDDLDRLAHVDALTGLANRGAAGRLLEGVCRSGGWGLLFLDVDDFKSVNDVHGHTTGDRALQEVGQRVRGAVGPHDVVARWSGDEFVVLLHDAAGPDALDDAARAVRERVAQPFDVDGHRVPLSVSVGAVAVRAGDTPEQVLRTADAAMYRAKRARTAVVPSVTAPLAVPPGWRPRSELDLVAQRLEAVSRFHEVRHASEQLREASGRTREQREALQRRHDVLRRQHRAVLERTAEQLGETARLLRPRTVPRVVLAHSDAHFRDVVADVLRDHGLDVMASVEGGAEAVGVCIAEQPDLLLVEDGLSLQSGDGVVRDVQVYSPGTVVVAQVARGARVAALLEAGAASVFAGPVPPHEVARDLRRLVSSRRGG